MKTYKLLTSIGRALLFFSVIANAHSAATDLATAPLATSATTSVLPNIMFVLDDSGSMGWDYLPDWANDRDPVSGSNYNSIPKLFRNSGFNGVAYNPAITYTPPTKYNADGTINTTTYPSMTSANTTAWTVVKDDGYGVQSTSNSNLVNNAYAYVFVPGEYCTAANLKTCTTASAPSTTYPYPAGLRWCSNSAMTSCQASWITSTYTYPRYPNQATATIAVGGTSSTTTVSSITVNGFNILTAATTASASNLSIASDIAAKINACFTGATGNCTVAGYSATSLSGTVTINAPGNAGAIVYTPVITSSGSMTFTPTAFSGYSLPGVNIRTDIVSSNDSYAYPGTTSKASTRTDCAGTTCTYAEAMTNYANWWAYYRTRMQMMKTSASNAFASVGLNYRLGYSSINNNTGSDFLNIAQCTTTQKNSWYAKLFAAKPNNSTPLREALSKVGRLYAGKLTTFNSVAATDPMQYSCQQNFSILSTDGYWNGNAGYQLDGSTALGNQDGSEPRPYNDGATNMYQKSTSQLQQTTTQTVQNTSQLQSDTQQIQSSTSKLQQQITQLQTSTSSLQSQTSQLQRSTSALQIRTSTNSGSTWTSWANTGSCTVISSGTNQTQCRYTSYSAWAGASSCTAVAQDSKSPYTIATAEQCRTVVTSAFANAGSCTVTTTPDASGYTKQCRYTAYSAWAGASSCTAAAQDAGPSYAVGTATQCRSVVTSAFANAGSCTATTTPDASGHTTQCQYTAFTAYANAGSCTPLAQDAGPGYTVGIATQCRTTATGWVGVGTCTPGVTGGQTVTCQTATTGPTPMAAGSCTAQTAKSSNSWVQITCPTITTVTGVSACTPVSASSSNAYTATTCNTVTTGPASVAACTAQTGDATNSWLNITCTGPALTGGTSNTLADVAQYYYATDLRTSAQGNCTGAPVPPAVSGNTLCSAASPDPYNNVQTSGVDAAATQHMTTFTLGLGASGYMQYSPSYTTATSGDYFDVKNGTTANPSGGICAWQASGACNWPTPASDSQANIDDLWHAAVNGRGTYFSATNPATLSSSLSSALAGVSARTGSSAAATTSNPNVTSGDNFVFSTTFTTSAWDGELVRQQLDLTTGVTSSTIDWAAQTKLDANSSRTIYTYSSVASNHLQPFTYATLGAYQTYFIPPNISALSQFCSVGVTCLSPADQVLAAGDNLVNYMRGARVNEGISTDTSKYYRQRAHVLGDIVNAEAVYVKGSAYNYVDLGYSAFVATNATRQGMVYAAGNDGMLHAFYAADASGIVGGDEAWAYIPSMVLPNLYKLADKNYSNLHQYFVDGTPVVGDICVSSCTVAPSAVWKTILVGGLNGGGRGYYAIDITDPATPKVLWEFTETNLGYTYGNPKITKLKDGTWVVMVASGYNNVSPGDGQGRLYVLNAATGALVTSVNPSGTTPGTISTGVGSSSATIAGICTALPCASGLAHIAANVVNPSTDNTVLAVYGGDMYGNLWRFDVNGDVGAAGYDAQLLATLRGPSSNIQPLTAKPEVGLVNGNLMVYVGTGRYIGVSDLSDSSAQSIYAIKDSLGATSYGSPRSTTCASSSDAGCFIQQTQTNTTCPVSTPSSICKTGQIVRTSSSNVVNLATQNGWYIDLPDSGERANTDPTLALGTLGFTTNVPNVDACTVGGYSYRYFLDYRTGAAVSTSTTKVVASRLGNALATRPVYVRLPNNAVVELTRLSDGTTLTSDVPIGAGATTTRRTSWRELISE